MTHQRDPFLQWFLRHIRRPRYLVGIVLVSSWWHTVTASPEAAPHKSPLEENLLSVNAWGSPTEDTSDIATSFSHTLTTTQMGDTMGKSVTRPEGFVDIQNEHEPKAMPKERRESLPKLGRPSYKQGVANALIFFMLLMNLLFLTYRRKLPVDAKSTEQVENNAESLMSPSKHPLDQLQEAVNTARKLESLLGTPAATMSFKHLEDTVSRLAQQGAQEAPQEELISQAWGEVDALHRAALQRAGELVQEVKRSYIASGWKTPGLERLKVLGGPNLSQGITLFLNRLKMTAASLLESSQQVRMRINVSGPKPEKCESAQPLVSAASDLAFLQESQRCMMYVSETWESLTHDATNFIRDYLEREQQKEFRNIASLYKTQKLSCKMALSSNSPLLPAEAKAAIGEVQEVLNSLRAQLMKLQSALDALHDSRTMDDVLTANEEAQTTATTIMELLQANTQRLNTFPEMLELFDSQFAREHNWKTVELGRIAVAAHRRIEQILQEVTTQESAALQAARAGRLVSPRVFKLVRESLQRLEKEADKVSIDAVDFVEQMHDLSSSANDNPNGESNTTSVSSKSNAFQLPRSSLHTLLEKSLGKIQDLRTDAERLNLHWKLLLLLEADLHHSNALVAHAAAEKPLPELSNMLREFADTGSTARKQWTTASISAVASEVQMIALKVFYASHVGVSKKGGRLLKALRKT